MTWIFFFTIISSLFLHLLSEECPSIYLRYSQDHSFCKPKSSTCPIVVTGVSDASKQKIVDLHNAYRSFVATGGETRAGGLPPAADMLQMVWDDELQTIAQRRAESCLHEHDCSDCRRVENFSVGQSIAYRERMCFGDIQCQTNPDPDWDAVIKSYYEEVVLFNKYFIKSMMFPPGVRYGHLTQVLWSKTWRIGCGYVVYTTEKGYMEIYVCNYGPSGNIKGTPMYEIGPVCSSCPINSCCGISCKHPDYSGLCRMNEDNEAPLYRPKVAYLLYCDFRSAAGDCNSTVLGTNKWKFVNALEGPYVEIVLEGDETSTLQLKNVIRPRPNFCLFVMYRYGPAVHGQKSSGKATVTFEMPNVGSSVMMLPKASENLQYFKYSISIDWMFDTEVSFTFSVPKGDPAQFFNLRLVSAKNGRCD